MVEAKWTERRSGREAQRINDPRAPEDHDLARVIHSGSFRRLQSKTQVLGLGESDFYRTRLTHSVEVAQIATGILRQIGKNPTSEVKAILPGIPTATAISLAHDIGHPPFGHGGEVALNFMMRGKNGFEGNGQTIRILCRLEKKTEAFGLDLTRRTLLGVLKYPRKFSEVVGKRQTRKGVESEETPFRRVNDQDWKPPKCYFDEDQPIIDWILEPLTQEDRRRFLSLKEKPSERKHGKTRYKSFDASLMDLSDDISYAVHDLEDAIHLSFLKNCDSDKKLLNEVFDGIDDKWLHEWELNNIVTDLFGRKWERKEAISKLVNCLICSCDVEEREGFSEPLLRFNVSIESQAEKLIDRLKGLVVANVIKTPEVQTLEYSGQLLVMELFEAMANSPKRLLPLDTQEHIASTNIPITRVVCDHISGMTDDYAAKTHGRLFAPNTGSIFEKM